MSRPAPSGNSPGRTDRPHPRRERTAVLTPCSTSTAGDAPREAKEFHRRWSKEIAGGSGSAEAGTSLRVYPLGGGGKSGGEQFSVEGTLADFMAEVGPSRRQERLPA